MDITRGYVVVGSNGEWLSRPFGSVEAAADASLRIDGVRGIIEINMVYTGSVAQR